LRFLARNQKSKYDRDEHALGLATPMCRVPSQTAQNRNSSALAPEHTRKPTIQPWGFQDAVPEYRHLQKLGVHRPKGLKSQLWKEINWSTGPVNHCHAICYR